MSGLDNYQSAEEDDLDRARKLLDVLDDAESDDQGVSYSLKAIAHVMLWQAEQQREWQREQAKAIQLAKEWRESQPPPPPPVPFFPPAHPSF
jgi:hypothetical protein